MWRRAPRAALRAIPNLYCITDAVAASGMPSGEYRLGQHRIFKQDDAVRLADGTLAGSVLTMDRALRNLMHLGLPLEEAARRCATLPADHLGLEDRGRLVPGAVADVVVDRGGGSGGVHRRSGDPGRGRLRPCGARRIRAQAGAVARVPGAKVIEPGAADDVPDARSAMARATA